MEILVLPVCSLTPAQLLRLLLELLTTSLLRLSRVRATTLSLTSGLWESFSTRWLHFNLLSMLSLSTNWLRESSRVNTRNYLATSLPSLTSSSSICSREILLLDLPFTRSSATLLLNPASVNSLMVLASEMSSLTPFSITRTFLRSSSASNNRRRPKRRPKGRLSRLPSRANRIDKLLNSVERWRSLRLNKRCSK